MIPDWDLVSGWNGWDDDDNPDAADEAPWTPSKPRTVTCKNCGTEGLHWTDYKGKWFLFNAKSERHTCTNPFKKTAQEAFKEVI